MRNLFSCVLIAVLALPLWLAGCAPRVGGSDYGSTGVRGVQSITYGTVESVRVVHIEDESRTGETVGTLGGGVAGGVLGSLIGGGSGRTVATVGGAILGAAAGYAGSKALTGQQGYEITIRLDDSQIIAVTQGTDLTFSPGQRVKILSGGGSTRVTHM